MAQISRLSSRRGCGDLSGHRCLAMIFSVLVAVFSVSMYLSTTGSLSDYGLLLQQVSLTTEENTLESSCRTSTQSLLSRETALDVVQTIYNTKCGKTVGKNGLLPKKGGCSFDDFGLTLLDRAREENLNLFTVQIGGMDGKSNDPMYKMFSSLEDLSHWIPAVFEPVKYNFRKLQETYREYQSEKSLSCSLLAQQAISDDPTTSTCTFCYFDNSPESPEACKKKPDWKRLQLGTLQCDEFQKYFAKDSNCVIHEDLPCRSIDQSVQQWGLSLSDVIILQVDVEGFELHIFQGMIESTKQRNSLPPVIHFETKVLKHRDQKNKTNKYEQLILVLDNAGYLIFDDFEDALGLLVGKRLDLDGV